MPPPKPKTLHILCFGDSLTSGFCNFGLDERPYSARLQQRLTAEFPGREIHVYTDGEPGELVLNGSWDARLRADLNKRRYDWVIMLGGTNDLGSVISEDRILEALEDRWAKVLSKGGKLLALTVPECHSRPGWLVERRALLNDDILAHEAPNFYSFDLHSRIPYHSLSRKTVRSTGTTACISQARATHGWEITLPTLFCRWSRLISTPRGPLRRSHPGEVKKRQSSSMRKG
uniref:SGNH hydrolase-type esterase domain-containing protein n=1 Tax=Bionectria ochroleuca TaxID=29856 RepID=A0A8H7TKU5_BIOOC